MSRQRYDEKYLGEYVEEHKVILYGEYRAVTNMDFPKARENGSDRKGVIEAGHECEIYTRIIKRNIALTNGRH